MKKVLQFLADDTGALSSMRLAFLLWTIMPLLLWGFVSLVKRELADIPPGFAMVMGGVLAGKVAQSFAER